MKKLNLPYIVRSVGTLSGIPVRLYNGDEPVCSYFPVKLPKDPFELYKPPVFSIKEHVGYYVTPLFHYYGEVNAGTMRIVIGPTAQIMANDRALKELAFALDVPKEETVDFVSGMKSIVHMPAESLIQMLCSLNHIMNDGEMLELSDVGIHSDEQEKLKTGLEKNRAKQEYEEAYETQENHNTLALEEALMDMVRRGETEALKKWLSSAPAVKGGTIAGDQLRQLKNTFIVTATLASRAAIRGGLTENDAFQLSDGYIRRAEILTSYAGIMNLQYNMLLEFTGQVEKLRHGLNPTKLTADVANYVRHHLSETITVEKMAAEFYMSRPYLSSRFKEESGRTLTDYILNEKTEEAKRLLKYSDKSAAAVASFLGFSSQGHFSRVFKKYAGVTPNEYRALSIC